jgi:OmpA-OmpF porin, OOP family
MKFFRSILKFMFMRRLLLTAVLAVSLCGLKAQFGTDYLRAADAYFKKGDYFSAATYYEKYLNGGNKKVRQTTYDPYAVQSSGKRSAGSINTSMQQAVYNLAESYRALNYHVKAEPVYKQSLDFDKTQYPLSRYHYATTLRALGKYDEAEAQFSEFLRSYTTDDSYKEAAQREVQNLRFIREQLVKKDLSAYTVNKAGAPLNTSGASYAPVWEGNNLLFTSTRPDSAAAKNKVYINRIYQAKEGMMDMVDRVNVPQGADIHQGVVSITPDGNTMFLSRWTVKSGKKTAALYSSKKSGAGWGEPVLLDAGINAEGFNAQQPSVTPDGKYLMYASDKPGGQGGFDLWYAALDADGKPGASVNFGEAINTKYDEQAPYYHAATHTLVFSGNGRVGMGGYDFFKSKGSMGNWAAPQNFGYPVNSVKDDIYFVSRGGAKNILEDVYISSDRSAECCLELFLLNRARPARQVSGRVVACDDNRPLGGATVEVLDTVNNKTVATATTDESGQYQFTIPDFERYKVVAASTGYTPGSMQMGMPAEEDAEAMSNPVICLNAPKQDETLVLDDIFYDFDKANLKDESTPSLDRLVEVLNKYPTMVIEVSAHTDSKGSDDYNQRLSERRAASVVKYLTEKGIAAERLQSKGYGESQPIAPNTNEDGTDNPEGRQKNRRTAFKVVSK